MRKDVDDDTREIIESFIVEAHERFDDAEAGLERLGSGDDVESLNMVFRLFHSVKGSAGFLEFDRVKTLTHEAEALLEVFIKEKIPYTQEALDVIYQTIDVLRDMVKAVEADFSDESCSDSAAMQAARIALVIDTLRHDQAPGASLDEGKGGQDGQGAPDLSASSDSSPSLGNPSNNVVRLNELVTRDMAEKFIAESADLLERVERDALSLETSTDKDEAVHSMFRAVHTVKGNAGFFDYGLLESDCMDLEQVLDGARKKSVPANEALVNTVLSRVDALRSMLATVRYAEEGEEPTTESQEASASPESAAPVQTAPAPARASVPPELPATRAPEAPAATLAKDAYHPLGEILVDIGAVPEAEIRKALEMQEKPLGKILVEAGTAKPEDVDKALEIQRSLGPDRSKSEEILRREIRVDTMKLDKLFDLVGELITSVSMVGNSPDLEGLKLDHFQKSFNALAKISREIQETTMMIRMIPLEGLFHKMARLVRDLSRKFDKPVDFQVSGEDTEMDKNVIEQVSDPLVHILRNALDHGLESPEARTASGKAPTGVLSLDARYEGSEIWISVKDDGAGLDRNRILTKAMERGLVKGDPSLVSDKEVWAYIFEPGFSTAERVSEVSGRGVGMDVVKRNLEKIRGRVDIRTESGKGTEFILQIPLTMAIIDGITVRAGSSHFSIPLSDILEFFKVRPEQLTYTDKGQATVNLRGAVMPLLKLGEIFSVMDAVAEPTEGTILVVQSAGKRACLLIDEVVGNHQIVIKSLSEYLGKVEGISGCAILGDGGVSFIIDTRRLMGLRLE